MRLIYFSAKRFNNFSADNAYMLALAESFRRELKDDLLIVCANTDERLNGYNLVNLKIKEIRGIGRLNYWLPYLVMLFWTPYFIISRKARTEDDIFFLGDRILLLYLLFWKKLFRRKFQICSDWHMFYPSWKETFVAQHSDRLITTSEKLRQILINKAGVAVDKILTVYGGIDVDKIKPFGTGEAREALQLPAVGKLIGYIGQFKTMGMEKGLDTMIKALKFLPTDYKMIFVGGREEEIKSYQNMADAEKVAERCLFFGRKTFEEVVMFEQACDAVVIPYPDQPHFRDFGFPMKVYEYMAAKKPIIYSRLELTEEVLADCGFLFTPDDAKNLAEVVQYVFAENNRVEVGRKVANAFGKAINYSWENKAKKIIEFIRI